MAEQKLIRVNDFLDDPLRIFANHEMSAFLDGSTTTKLTVLLNLFGGTVITLGTDKHKTIANGINDLTVIGCFALTELGFGNNAVEMETTATWDPEH
jgi:acyl-CoA oxidase